MNYDDLIGSPEQLRYDGLCCEFAQVANLIVDDKGRSSAIMECIKLQCNEL